MSTEFDMLSLFKNGLTSLVKVSKIVLDKLFWNCNVLFVIELTISQTVIRTTYVQYINELLRKTDSYFSVYDFNKIIYSLPDQLEYQLKRNVEVRWKMNVKGDGNHCMNQISFMGRFATGLRNARNHISQICDYEMPPYLWQDYDNDVVATFSETQLHKLIIRKYSEFF